MVIDYLICMPISEGVCAGRPWPQFIYTFCIEYGFILRNLFTFPFILYQI